MTDRPASPLEQAIVDGLILQADRAGGELHWSFGTLLSLTRDAPEHAWPILLDLIARAPDRALGDVGAGPLEDLLAAHGQTIIGTVEAEAARDPRLRRTLRGVWQNAMPDDVWSRVVAASRPDEATPEEVDGHDEAVDGHDASPPRRFEFDVPGLPPGAGDPQAIPRLAAAIADVAIDHPIERPVGIEIAMRLAPGSETPPADAVLATTIGQLVAANAIASAALVWRAEFTRTTEEADRYDLEIFVMSDEQVEAMSTLAKPWTEDGPEFPESFVDIYQAAYRSMRPPDPTD